jgi:hypothetical protein
MGNQSIVSETTAPISLQEAFIKTAFKDTSSPENKAVFFSGPKAKRKMAKLCSKSDGFANVCQSEALGAFNEYQSFAFGKNATISLQDYYFIGDCISEAFADNASGTVRIYLDGVKGDGTFNRAEIPALLKNDKVTDFLVYDAMPKQSGIEPFEEIQMNKEELRDYIDRSIVGQVSRGIHQSNNQTSTIS